MSNSSKITFIIPNRGGEQVGFVSSQLKKAYPESKIIVITQDDNKPFARGQLFNIGYSFTDTEYMCFMDNDMFFPEYVDLVSVYENLKCIALQPFKNLRQIKRTGNEYKKISENYKGNSSKGGVTFISKSNFERVNGMSNVYLGWGFEDNEFDYRAHIAEIDGVICHIKHTYRGVRNHNTALNNKYYNERKNRKASEDGYKNTTYNITKRETIDGIDFIYVNEIYVNEGFPYKALIERHYKVVPKKQPSKEEAKFIKAKSHKNTIIQIKENMKHRYNRPMGGFFS